MHDWNLDDLRADPATPGGWHVRANMVASLDGAGWFDGRSGPLSGPADVRLFRALRAVCDVVLVGAGTVRAEDYGPLTLAEEFTEWRTLRGLSPLPRLAVLSGRLALDPRSRLFQSPPPGGEPVLLLTAGAAAPDQHRALSPVAQIVTVDELSPATLAEALTARGLPRIHLEGGPSTLGDFVAADLVDELRLSQSPVIAGDGPDAGGRIVTGAPLATPRPMTLDSLTEQDGFVFLSYVRERDRG